MGKESSLQKLKTQLAIEIYPEIPPNKRDEDTQKFDCYLPLYSSFPDGANVARRDH